MKFLIDAQLPRRLAILLVNHGHDAVHTLDLPLGNATPDSDLLRVAAQDGRVIVTKDADFVNSFHIRGEPDKLLLVATGNLRNADLETLVLANLAAMVGALAASRLVELTRTALIIHG